MNAPQKSILKRTRKKHAESSCQRLKRELASARMELQAHDDRAIYSDVELRSSNSLLLSANVELEVAQSQLTAVNAELNSAVESLVEIPALFVDANLRVSRITASASPVPPVTFFKDGLSADRIAPDSLGAELATDIRRALADNAVISREVQCRGIWFDRKIFPYRGPDGRTRGTTVTYVDISERRRAEEHCRARVHALTVANSELEAFVSSVSHDLRNPLHVVLSCVDAVRSTPVAGDPVCREALDHIDQSVTRMSQIIGDLLALSHITQKEIRREPVDLTEMARTFFNELVRTSPSRSVQFVTTPGLLAMADAGLVRIALENLIRNAWKFTSKREDARIEFGMTGSGEPPTFYLRDNGVGFDCSAADKLFKPFGRLHCNQEFKGTGIGLVTVKRIAEKHGGSAWAEGAVGEGATVYFRLS